MIFQKKKKKPDDSIVNNVMGEKNIFNKLIVMDDISGLDDRSNEFVNLLTLLASTFFILFTLPGQIGR